MIVAIESSLATFKTIRFHAGLNVLLADTQPDSTDKQTRNSAGKTSLVEIIHFLMGSNCDKDSLFRTKALIEHTFTGEFFIAGEQFTVQRGGAEGAGSEGGRWPAAVDNANDPPECYAGSYHS